MSARNSSIFTGRGKAWGRQPNGTGGAGLPIAPETPPIPPSPPGTTSITLGVRRLAPGSGSTLVSSCIPLRPGDCLPAAIGNIAIFVAGVEKSIYIEALEGRHADGSLRSVLVQFTHSLTAGTQLGGECRIGTARTTSDIGVKTAINSQSTMPQVHPSFGVGADSGTHQLYLYGFPVAVALPTSPAHLIACDLVSPMLARDTEFALGGEYTRRIRDFENGVGPRWTIWSQPAFPGVFANSIGDVVYDTFYYDRALGYFAHYVATGNIDTYFRQACSYLYAFREIYARPAGDDELQTGNGYRYNYQNAFPEGALCHYWLTGDPESSRMVVQQATHNLRSFAYDTCQGSRFNVNQDPREMSYALKNWMACWRLGRTLFTSRQNGEVVSVLAQCRLGLDRILGINTYVNDGSVFPSLPRDVERPMYQTTGTQDGVWAQTLAANCPNTLTIFMIGLVCDILIKYYRWVEADSRIPAAVKEAMDWAWNNHWRPNRGATSTQSFDYLSDNNCGGEGGQDPTPTLNHLYTSQMAWIGRQFGNSTYYTRALAIAAGSNSTDVSSDLASSGKLFNQQQVLSFPFAKYIQG